MRKKNKLIHGVGVNDADYPIFTRDKLNKNGELEIKAWRCPFYTKWAAMLNRCYSDLIKPSYLGCYVTSEWHYFMSFRAWMVQQDWEGKELDKDLLIPNNKVYSPENCVFLDSHVNKFLIESFTKRGNYPIGVSYSKDRDKFKAECRDVETGKKEYLGHFNSALEAHEVWLTFKTEQARILSERQTDPRVAKALIERYENYGK